MCDMPLVRIWGTDPEMREDMVKIGSGMTKTANLAYRAQFTHWAIRVTGEFNNSAFGTDNEGRLRPSDVVHAAKSPASALHPHFEWNDKVAAGKYRLDQAREIGFRGWAGLVFSLHLLINRKEKRG